MFHIGMYNIESDGGMSNYTGFKTTIEANVTMWKVWISDIHSVVRFAKVFEEKKTQQFKLEIVTTIHWKKNNSL